jgi:putative Holliday junction resolvase
MNEFHFSNGHPLILKTVLAIDFGERFIGLATYCVNRDPYPTPYGRIENKGWDFVKKELQRVLNDECIEIFVIGVPHLLDGKATSSTQRARDFIQLIQNHFTLPLYEQDETLSTFEAESRMKNSPQYNFQVDYSKIDAVAASVILEDFIRQQKNKLEV